jgi:hypothetical protein
MLPVRALFLVSASGLLFSILLTASAHALPVTLYANGSASTGFDPADVAAALAAGASAPTPVVGLGDGDGYFSITTPDGIPGVKGKSKDNPSRGTSTWTLHVSPETPADLLQNFCVVILGHDPNDPRKYQTKNVGLEISTDLPWRLVTPLAGGATYLAYQLGELEAGESYEIPIEYRVGQKLEKKKGVSIFPRYAVAYLSLPEPSTLVLGLAGVAFALGARRTTRCRAATRLVSAVVVRAEPRAAAASADTVAPPLEGRRA